MRKFLKKQILNMLATLEDAHKEIAKYIKSGDVNTATGIMTECQKSAIAIGNAIEKSEGTDFKTISYLEDYCDLLYNLCEVLQSGEKPGVSKLKKELSKIQYSVEEDVKTKIEIAFFPYKASMWDSLESIWLAAKEDDRCECFVVPIPYFDRNPDHSMGTMHYEGTKFPDYVPVVDWQKYNLEVQKPDIAYIHNPYDQFNYVTSVHPAYYSHELKKHVDTLVYVPYYATSGDMSTGQTMLSAYYYSDYIIMQSEWHRPFFDSAIPQERLLPLGSPKFDRVIRMTKQKPEPPSGWRDKMAGRKVYFFNTSIGGLLGNTEVFLRKMAYVFNCFYGREDVLLLWRPHPLLESTLDSMRPQFKPLYMELKKWFIESGLGIYDDTPDIDLSIALSDVYIGDSGTSVTSLFGMSGKPIFIFNNNLDKQPEPEDSTTFGLSSSMYIEGTTAWFASYYSWLVRLDLESGKVEPICKLSNMTLGHYSDVEIIGDRIYVGPTNAQDLCVVEGGNLRKVPLKELNRRSDSFVKMIRYKQYLYLIPGRYPALVRYDTDSDELTYYCDCANEFIAEEDGAKFLQGVCIRDNLLYIASAFDNRMLIFDMENGKYKIEKVGQITDSGCQSMTDDGVDFWLLPVKGNTVTRWNPVTNEVFEYSQFPQDFACLHPSGYLCDERPFISAVCFDDFVLLVPFWSNMFIKIDKKTGAISQWNTPFEMLQKPKNCYYNWGLRFGAVLKTGKTEFMTFSYYDRVLYCIDVEKGEYKQSQYHLDAEFCRENEYGFNQVSEWQQYACMENELNTLPGFLEGKITGKPFDAQRQFELYSKISVNGDGTCGEKVHKHITDEFLTKRR